LGQSWAIMGNERPEGALHFPAQTIILKRLTRIRLRSLLKSFCKLKFRQCYAKLPMNGPDIAPIGRAMGNGPTGQYLPQVGAPFFPN
jgi:hypothetical protein